MNVIIKRILPLRPSMFKIAQYFIIKCIDENGIEYDIIPSSDCQGFNEWIRIANEYGENTKLHGLQFQGKGMKKNRKILNKKVLPTKIEKL